MVKQPGLFDETDEPTFGPRTNEYAITSEAKPGQCRSCGATIIWITTPNGHAMPLSIQSIQRRDGTAYALPHFADCPQGRIGANADATT